MTPIRPSFVCLGNICRSPMAQGVFENLVAASGRSGEFVIESAGIGSWHVDGEVADELRRLAPTRADQAKVRLLRAFDPLVAGQSSGLRQNDTLDVPDPYYGDPAGFEDVYQMIERACRGLFETLRPAA